MANPATARSTTSMSTDHALAQALQAKPMLVVGFCAAWCNTCAEFSAAFDRLAASRRDAAFVWLDIEDDADVAGDIDIENFPTLAVFSRRRLLHFGTSLPQSPVVTRLLDSLDEGSKTINAAESVTSLPERLIAMSPETARRALRQG